DRTRWNEEIPEKELLKRVGVFFVREGAAIVALRQRAAALQHALVEAALALNRLGERRFARFESPPEKLPQQRRVAGERELERVASSARISATSACRSPALLQIGVAVTSTTRAASVRRASAS